MLPHINASSPEELVAQVSEDLSSLSTKNLSDAAWVERQQMDRYLLFKSPSLDYPVQVLHTTAYGTELIPDFLLNIEPVSIGIEATRIHLPPKNVPFWNLLIWENDNLDSFKV